MQGSSRGMNQATTHQKSWNTDIYKGQKGDSSSCTVAELCRNGNKIATHSWNEQKTVDMRRSALDKGWWW